MEGNTQYKSLFIAEFDFISIRQEKGIAYTLTQLHIHLFNIFILCAFKFIYIYILEDY